MTRTESSADRRYQEIKLTSNAIKLVPKLASIADENDGSFFSILLPSERKALRKILIKLGELHKINTKPIE